MGAKYKDIRLYSCPVCVEFLCRANDDGSYTCAVCKHQFSVCCDARHASSPMYCGSAIHPTCSICFPVKKAEKELKKLTNIIKKSKTKTNKPNFCQQQNSFLAMQLTRCQKDAFEKIKFFIQDESADYEPVIMLNGSAGVGKSTLMRHVVDYLKRETQLAVAVVAPTHKALHVILDMLNQNSFFKIPGFTLASILGKIKEHSYIGTKKFSDANTTKMNNFDIFIMDEVSMVCDADLEVIFDFVCSNNKKLIMIGDSCQIPSPAQKIKAADGVCFKPDSIAFNVANKVTLHQIVRQQQDSLIIKLATFLRDNLSTALTIHEILSACSIPEEQILITENHQARVYEQIVYDLMHNKSAKIICYTNEQVKNHNMQLRKALRRTQKFSLGEVVVGYTNGSTVENGSEYIITDVKQVENKRIDTFSKLHGHALVLANFYNPQEIVKAFAILVDDPQNKGFMEKLITLATRVNRRNSTTQDYRDYMRLKGQALFIEDVYKYENSIYNETDLKKAHPLLFAAVLDVIDEKKRKIIPSEMSTSLISQYEHLVKTRIEDTAKGFTENEVFADMLKIVEKDIYYGYAITAHKSQGSTYNSVYVDENDFQKIKSRWNPRFQLIESRTKEQNQLRYVSYTRASETLKIFK